jgi:hypothetical protein
VRSMGLVDAYGDMLAGLEHDRRAHSLAVGRKAEGAAARVAPALRVELVAGGRAP